jgi:hypothetical protein
MELLWKDGNANDGETCWDAEYLGEEVLNLLTVEVFLCVVSASGYHNFSIPGPWA